MKWVVSKSDFSEYAHKYLMHIGIEKKIPLSAI